MDLNYSITSRLRTRDIFTENISNQPIFKNRFEKYQPAGFKENINHHVPNNPLQQNLSMPQKDPILRILERKGIESLIKDVITKNPDIIAGSPQLQPHNNHIEDNSNKNNEDLSTNQVKEANHVPKTLRKFEDQLNILKETFKGMKMDIDNTFLKEKIQFNSLLQREIENKFKKFLSASKQNVNGEGHISARNSEAKLQADKGTEEMDFGEKTQKKVKKDVQELASEMAGAPKKEQEQSSSVLSGGKVKKGSGLKYSGRRSRGGSENKVNGDGSSLKKRKERSKKKSKKGDMKANVMQNLMLLATEVKGPKRVLSEKTKPGRKPIAFETPGPSTKISLNETLVNYKEAKAEGSKALGIKKTASSHKGNDKDDFGEQSPPMFEIISSPKSESGY